MRLKKLGLLFICLFLLPSLAEKSSASLISPYETARKESSIPIGIHIQIPKGWYINEKTSQRAKALKIQWLHPQKPQALPWPPAQKISKDSSIRAYKNSLLLPYSFLIPTTWTKKNVSFQALAKWVICSENLCIPFEKTLSLTLPLAAANKINPQTAALFEQNPPKNISKAFIFFILLAFLGGLILNFMPCAAPIIFLKLHSIQQKENLQASALAYSGGVVSSFLLLAFLVSYLKESWGFQMQSPIFISLLILFFTFAGFYFLKPFSLPLFFQKKKNSAAPSFLTGVFAVLFTTPCTAPFMAMALGWAFSQNTFSIFVIFLSLGFGMACPFILFSFFPKFLKKLPQLNQTFQQGMAFIFFAVSAWLLSILSSLEPSWFLPLLFSLIGFGFLIWMKNPKTLPAGLLFLAVLVLSLGLSFYPLLKRPALEWEEFSIQRLESSLKNQEPVFVYFTAKWCLTCQWNERVFKNKQIIQEVEKQKILMLKGDWTSKNQAIADTLKKYNRAGIPFSLFFPKNQKTPIFLPELLSSKNVLKAMN